MSPERARELFRYVPETGEFTWQVSKGTAEPGMTAGTVTACNPYVSVIVDRVAYPVTTLIWLMVYNRRPNKGMRIDHKNRNPRDNRLDNLREISHAENLQNRGPQANNTTGFKGVSYHKVAKKYTANITVNRKTRYLGLFTTPEDAYRAYCAAAVKYHSCAPEEVISCPLLTTGTKHEIR